MNPNLKTRRRFIRICLAVFAVFWIADSRTKAADEAGPQYYARIWQADDGLPRNSITSIAQTADGYLWLGTPFGVIRFDGITFTTLSDEAGGNFARIRTRVLYADAADQLWIGTGTEGIIQRSGTDSKLISHANGLPHPTINAICEDRQMKLWVATGDGQVSWVDKNGVVHPMGLLLGRQSSVAIQLVRDRTGIMWFAQGAAYGQLVDGVATNVVNAANDPAVICPNHLGGVWLFSGTNLFRIGEQNHQAEPMPGALPAKLNQVTALFEDRQGGLWLGTRNQGIYRYSNGRFFQELDTPHRIMAFFQDMENNLWVGTEGGGLIRLQPKIFSTISPHKSSPDFPVLSVCKDRDGNVWLSPQGLGLACWNDGSLMKNFASFRDFGTTAVLPNPDGGVWVGTVNHGLYQVAATKAKCLTAQYAFKTRQIRVLHQDARKNLWLGCLPDGLAKIAAGKITLPNEFFSQGLPRTAILSVADDRSGKLWLGTITGELYAYDGSQFIPVDKTNGLPGEAIGSLYAATNGDLWVGTLGGGLGRYRDGQLVFCDTRDGLADDVIATIVDGGDGFFWLGSERGIFRVKQSELNTFADGKTTRVESIRYGRDDGLANVEMAGGHQPAAWKTDSGEIWFATSKGAVRMNPGALKINARPPPLILEKILVDDVSITNRNHLKFDHGYHKLEFQYTATSLVSSERIHFRRQLEGFDPTWVDTGSSRSAVYPQLSPGNYVFRFTACNSDGVWNEHPISVAFVVTPAFWQTIWFRALALGAFGGLVAVAVRYRYRLKMRRKLLVLQQANAVEQERMRIARDIHDDLGARLTQMAFLSEISAKEVAADSKLGGLLQKIAQSSRQSTRSLEEIVWAVNPLKDSLPHLVDYLSHYANEYFRDTEIRCRQDLPLIVPEIPLAADMRHHLFLACKEALNNIRKHAQATEVWLRVALTADEIQLTIEDNGVGFGMATSKPAGNGLLNLQSRLAHLGGRCEISSQPGRGTRVFFAFKQPPGASKESPAPAAGANRPSQN